MNNFTSSDKDQDATKKQRLASARAAKQAADAEAGSGTTPSPDQSEPKMEPEVDLAVDADLIPATTVAVASLQVAATGSTPPAVQPLVPPVKKSIQFVIPAVNSSGPSNKRIEPILPASAIAKLTEYRSNGPTAYQCTEQNWAVRFGRFTSTTAGQSAFFTKEDGKLSYTAAALLSNMAFSPTSAAQYPMMVIGIPSRASVSDGPESMYADVAIQVENGQTTLTQLTIPWVVLTGQSNQQRLAAGKNKGQGGRINGVDYIRIGIPLAFAYPILMPLISGVVTNNDTTTVTDNYVWVTAGWGNKTRPAEFQFQTPTGTQTKTDQRAMHTSLEGKSSLGVATLSISLSWGQKVENATKVPDPLDCSMSVKLYSHKHLKMGDWCNGDNSATADLLLSEQEMDDLGMGECQF